MALVCCYWSVSDVLITSARWSTVRWSGIEGLERRFFGNATCKGFWGTSHRDSAAVAEVTVNLMEVVYGNPATRLEFEDMDEKSDDDDTQTAQERKREHGWGNGKCMLSVSYIGIYSQCSLLKAASMDFVRIGSLTLSLYRLPRSLRSAKWFVRFEESSHTHTNPRQSYIKRWEIPTRL